MGEAAEPAPGPMPAPERIAARFVRELAPLRPQLLAGLDSLAGPGHGERCLTSLLVRLAYLKFLEQAGFLCGDRGFLRRALTSGNAFYASIFEPLVTGGTVGAERAHPLVGRLAEVAGLSRILFLSHPMAPGNHSVGAADRGHCFPQPAFSRVPMSSPAALAPGGQPVRAPDGGTDRLHFQSWLELLDGWSWRLDEQSHGERTMTPAVLGCLFERLLHDRERSERGAFYTAPDVTGMICRITLVPQVIAMLGRSGAAGRRAAAGFVPPGAALDYLPRGALQPNGCPGPAALEPDRLARLRRASEEGRVRTADDAVTWNLDLPTLALRFIGRIEDPRVVAAFYFDCLTRLAVLDPACGAGAFLDAALHVLLPLYECCLERMRELAPRSTPGVRGRLEAELRRADEHPTLRHYACSRILEASLHGIDLMPEAVEVCRIRLLLRFLSHSSPVANSIHDLSRTIRLGDFLSATPHQSPLTNHQVIVGNPPYVESSREQRAAGCRYPNLYACFVERAFDLLAEGGRCAMIVPVSCISGPEYAPLMRHLLRGRCWISSYSNRPGKLFEGVEQRLAIFAAAPDEPPELFVSAYQHWNREERPFLFDRLEYAPASVWRTGFPLKTGSAVAERLFAKLARHRGSLPRAEAASPQAVWVHDAPTYWVRALPFEPNAGFVRARSSHYNRIGVSTEAEARMVAAVLSSTHFYFFFKMVSNCRDLGRKEIESFPIDTPPAELAEALAESGRLLAERLRETASVRTRVYPSGRVSYEEYYPARAWNVIREIDRLLAGHYGLTPEELDFLLHYDLKYRGNVKCQMSNVKKEPPP